MRTLKQLRWIGLLAFAMTFSDTAQAQFGIGVQAGVGVDTDETVGGLIARYSFGNIVVGANIDYGTWKWTFDSDSGSSKRDDHEQKGKVFHFTIPVAYMFALGEGGFSLFPFLQVGTASWSLDNCENCDSESETTFDAGAGAQYKFIFVTGAANVLGEDKGGSDFTFRVGGIFAL